MTSTIKSSCNAEDASENIERERPKNAELPDKKQDQPVEYISIDKLNTVNYIVSIPAIIAGIYLTCIASTGPLMHYLLILAACNLILQPFNIYHFWQKGRSTKTLAADPKEDSKKEADSKKNDNKLTLKAIGGYLAKLLLLSAVVGNTIALFLSTQLFMIHLGYSITVAMTLAVMIAIMTNMSTLLRTGKSIQAFFKEKGTTNNPNFMIRQLTLLKNFLFDDGPKAMSSIKANQDKSLEQSKTSKNKAYSMLKIISLNLSLLFLALSAVLAIAYPILQPPTFISLITHPIVVCILVNLTVIIGLIQFSKYLKNMSKIGILFCLIDGGLASFLTIESFHLKYIASPQFIVIIALATLLAAAQFIGTALYGYNFFNDPKNEKMEESTAINQRDSTAKQPDQKAAHAPKNTSSKKKAGSFWRAVFYGALLAATMSAAGVMYTKFVASQLLGLQHSMNPHLVMALGIIVSALFGLKTFVNFYYNYRRYTTPYDLMISRPTVLKAGPAATLSTQAAVTSATIQKANDTNIKKTPIISAPDNDKDKNPRTKDLYPKVTPPDLTISRPKVLKAAPAATFDPNTTKNNAKTPTIQGQEEPIKASILVSNNSNPNASVTKNQL